MTAAEGSSLEHHADRSPEADDGFPVEVVPGGASGDMHAAPKLVETRFGVLRHAHFRTMWIASFGVYVGGWFEFVAMRWLVSQETKSEAWLSGLLTAQLGPTLLLGMLGGLIADSVNRRTLLIYTQAAMMIIAMLMAAAAFTGHATKWVFLWLALAQGVTTVFNSPAWQTLTPRLVPKSDLTRAITLQGISFNTARVVGPAVGGAIMGAFATSGAAVLLLASAIAFIGVMLGVLSTPDAPPAEHMRGLWKSPAQAWHRTKEAFAWVWLRKGPRAVLLATVVFAVFATPIMQLLPLVISEVYKREEGTFGTLLAIMGAGAVTGGFSTALVPKWYPMHHLIPLSITLGGIWLLLFSLTSNPVVAGCIMFPVGFFWMWGFNTCAAAMQHLVDDSMRGRISAVVNTIAMGLMPLGAYLASASGYLGERAISRWAPGSVNSGTGTQAGLAIVSTILVGAGLVMLIWRTPEVDGLSPGDPGYDRHPSLWRGIFATMHRPPDTRNP